MERRGEKQDEGKYVHLDIAACDGGIYRVHYTLNMRPEIGPLLLLQDHDRDLPLLEILLVAEVLICSEENVEPSALGGVQ